MNERTSNVSSAEEEALHRLVHGELRGPEAQRLRERMAQEPALAARCAELEAAWSALGESLPVPPTPDLAAAVRSRLREPDRGVFAALRESAYGGALAAAMLLVGVGTGWWVQNLWSAPGAAAGETLIAAATSEEPSVEETATVAQPVSRPPSAEPLPEESPEKPPEEPVRTATVTRPLGEDFETWSETLGDEPEWNEELFSSSVDELLADSESADSESVDSGSVDRVDGWDASLADGWGLPVTSSMAAAYLGLEESGD